MRWLELIGLVVVLSITGVLVAGDRIYRITEMRKFAIEYRDKFIEFTNRPTDQAIIVWLQLHARRIQNDSGSIGIISYRPTAANHYHLSYPVFLNLLGVIIQERQLDRGLGVYADSIMTNVRLMDTSLLQHIGTLDDKENEYRQLLKNPIRVIADGVRFYVQLPLHFLHWSGLITEQGLRAAISNPLLRIIGTIISLAGFLSATITIATGWHAFVGDIHSLLRAFGL